MDLHIRVDQKFHDFHQDIQDSMEQTHSRVTAVESTVLNLTEHELPSWKKEVAVSFDSIQETIRELEDQIFDIKEILSSDDLMGTMESNMGSSHMKESNRLSAKVTELESQLQALKYGV
eukprot:1078745-Karenia_brevis.AAC.1